MLNLRRKKSSVHLDVIKSLIKRGHFELVSRVKTCCRSIDKAFPITNSVYTKKMKASVSPAAKKDRAQEANEIMLFNPKLQK